MIEKPESSDYDIFMYNVQWLRKNHKLSKEKMAKYMEISIASLNKIEAGQFPKNLKINAILNIQKHFGVSASLLLSKRMK